jgi:hypothetical protein
LLVATTAWAADPPRLDYLSPIGGRRGTTVTITLGGNLKPWPVKVWTDATGLTFKADEMKEGQITVEIAKDAPIGVHHLRIHNAEGASWPRWFIVGHLPELNETEPNDSLAEAQGLEQLPVTLNGSFSKDSSEVDTFAVKLEAGQWVVASAEAFNVGAPVDASIEILDERDAVVAFNNDGDGLDPVLAYQAKRAGRFFVRIFGFWEPARADVRYLSTQSAVYRLTVTTGPYARYAVPAGVQRGRRSAVHLFGWNLGTTGNAIVRQVDATGLGRDVDKLPVTGPDLANRLPLIVSDAVEVREAEPNDARDQAVPLAPPCAVNGCVSTPGDEDRFALAMKKGQVCDLIVTAGALNSPLDAMLEIEDAAGNSVASNDDGGGKGDPKLRWTAPADGTYVAVVRDLIGTGGLEYVYRLEIKPPKPDFRATVSDHVFRMLPGKTAEMTVTVERIDGYKGAITAMVDGLPAGVTATSATVPAKGGAVTLTLTAAEDAKPAGGPVRVLAVSTQADAPQVRVATAPFKSQTDPKAYAIDNTDKIWVAVTPKPPPPEPKEKPDEKKK